MKQNKPKHIYVLCLFSVNAVGAFFAQFFQAKFCLQFCLVKMCEKCAQNPRKPAFCPPARVMGGGSYWHQPNFFEIGLVDKRPFFTTLRAFSAHFYQAELQANWRQICLLVLGKSVRKMRQLHIQKINKVWICFGLFCSILHIHSNAYTCIDLYVYQ